MVDVLNQNKNYFFISFFIYTNINKLLEKYQNTYQNNTIIMDIKYL